VVKLERQSHVYSKYYIRDKKGDIFELDQVTRADNRRDLVFFTVKNRRFNRYFHLQRDYILNDPVFTVGSALGDGIVIRNGLLIGETLERLEGKFYLLKSSAGVNPGNSGGPLLDARGSVIGVIQRKNDNIVYSLPVNEINESARNKFVYSAPSTNFRFININREFTATIAFDFSLPLPYQEVITKASIEYDAAEKKYMDQLLSDDEEPLFPDGKKSEMLLFTTQSSSCPELIYEKKEDGIWSITKTETNQSLLPASGRIETGKMKDDIITFNMTRPADVAIEMLYDSPKLMMDIYLKGVNHSRKLGSESIRISSLGSPVLSEKHVDRYDRTWFLNVWLINYDDKILAVMTLPSPNGVTGVSLVADSYKCNSVVNDFKVMADFLQLSFEASVSEWVEYLACSDSIPYIFRNITAKINAADGFVFRTPGFTVKLDDTVMEVSGDSLLKVDMGYFAAGKKISWGFRRILLKKSTDSLDYLSIGKEIHPVADLPREVQENWDRIIARKHPFTGRPYSSEGLTILCDIHKKYQDTGLDSSVLDHLYTVTIVTESVVNEEDFKKRFGDLVNSISITE